MAIKKWLVAISRVAKNRRILLVAIRTWLVAIRGRACGDKDVFAAIEGVFVATRKVLVAIRTCLWQ